MRKRLIIVFSLMVLAVLMLSACNGVISDAGQPAVDQSTSGNGNTAGNTGDTQPGQAAPVDSAPVVEDSQPNQGEETSGDDSSVSLPVRPELGFALGKADLVATDPSNVSLASGRLQLVEMFAFW